MPKNLYNAVIFDLGGVLIDWNPEYVFLDVFEGDKERTQWFLNTVCTMEWNEEQDAGRSMETATAERIKLFPAYAKYIRMYYGRWEEMLGNAIAPTVTVLQKLIAAPQLKVVALTNWSAETFPVALKRFEFLHWFEGIVVSGEEKMRKPTAAIYELTLNRFKLEAQNTVFIDDNLRNIKAANQLGIKGIHFSSALELEQQLVQLGLY